MGFGLVAPPQQAKAERLKETEQKKKKKTQKRKKESRLLQGTSPSLSLPDHKTENANP